MLRNNKNGFTIIEVVLVLAIAGLIFLMVFLAVPSMQASQRDTQRRSDVTIVIGAVQNYMKYNHGKMPPDSSTEDAGASTGVPESKSLERYLTDLEEGGVTKTVTVRNLIETNSQNVQFDSSTFSKDYYDVVSVIVGSKCPDINTDIISAT